MFCTNAHKMEVNKCPFCKIQELEQRISEYEKALKDVYSKTFIMSSYAGLECSQIIEKALENDEDDNDFLNKFQMKQVWFEED